MQSKTKVFDAKGRIWSFALRHGRLTALVLAAGIANGPSAWAAPIISPFAADLPASAYSADANLTGYLGSSAQSVFNGGYWNAGSQGAHWVQADMGTSQMLSMVKITLSSSAPVGSPGFVKVYLSDNPIGNTWSTLTPVAQLFAPWSYVVGGYPATLSFTPTSGRYLEVVANYATYSWTALGNVAARQDWVDPVLLGGGGGTPSGSVPESSTLALLLAGFLGLGVRRR